MGKKVACYIPYFWSPHLETDLDLMYTHARQGDDVTVFVCAGELPNCFSNVEHSDDICRQCVGRRRTGINGIGLTDLVSIRSFVNLSAEDRQTLERFKGLKITSKEELFGLELNSYSIGRSAYNEYVCFLNETEIDVGLHSDFFEKAVESGVLTYLSFRNNFAHEKFDCFYTFNGRFVTSQAAVCAAIEGQVPYVLHDRAGQLNKHWVVSNTSLHSLPYWADEMTRHWSSHPLQLDEKVKVGSEWFDHRRSNKKQFWYSFTADQNVALPESFDRSKTNIVVFSSSEWEFAGMEDYGSSLYPTQNDAVEIIAQELLDCPQFQIYYRIHPNQKGRTNSESKFIDDRLKGKYSNLEVLAADSPVNTYSLIDSADLVITFGSTTGIEAAYARTPSILLGRSWYDKLDVCDMPESREKFIAAVKSKEFCLSDEEKDRRKQNAAVFGFFCQTGGRELVAFEQTDVFETVFKVGPRVGQVFTYEQPQYPEGLKRELARRADVSYNPLSAIVTELQGEVEKLVVENNRQRQLLQEIQVVEAAKEVDGAPAATIEEVPNEQSNSTSHLRRIKASLRQRLRKLFPISGADV